MGREIDVALLHAGYYQMTFDISAALATGKDTSEPTQAMLELGEEILKERERLIADVQAATKRYQEFIREIAPNPIGIPYETKDGRPLVFAGFHPDKFWPDLCKVVGRPNMAEDPVCHAGGEARKPRRTVPHSQGDFLSKTLAEWRPLLGFMPHATIQTMVEAINDPQAAANDMFVSTNHPVHGLVKVIASPVNMSKTPLPTASLLQSSASTRKRSCWGLATRGKI